MRYTGSMAHPLLSDPFVRTVVDDAVAPFVDRLVPEELAWLEDQLAVALHGDADLAAILKGAHPRNMDASGERSPLDIGEHADDSAEHADDSADHAAAANGRE